MGSIINYISGVFGWDNAQYRKKAETSDSPDALLELGRQALAGKRYRQAAEYLEKALNGGLRQSERPEANKLLKTAKEQSAIKVSFDISMPTGSFWEWKPVYIDGVPGDPENKANGWQDPWEPYVLENGKIKFNRVKSSFVRNEQTPAIEVPIAFGAFEIKPHVSATKSSIDPIKFKWSSFHIADTVADPKNGQDVEKANFETFWAPTYGVNLGWTTYDLIPDSDIGRIFRIIFPILVNRVDLDVSKTENSAKVNYTTGFVNDQSVQHIVADPSKNYTVSNDILRFKGSLQTKEFEWSKYPLPFTTTFEVFFDYAKCYRHGKDLLLEMQQNDVTELYWGQYKLDALERAEITAHRNGSEVMRLRSQVPDVESLTTGFNVKSRMPSPVEWLRALKLSDNTRVHKGDDDSLNANFGFFTTKDGILPTQNGWYNNVLAVNSQYRLVDVTDPSGKVTGRKIEWINDGAFVKLPDYESSGFTVDLSWRANVEYLGNTFWLGDSGFWDSDASPIVKFLGLPLQALALLRPLGALSTADSPLYLNLQWGLRREDMKVLKDVYDPNSTEIESITTQYFGVGLEKSGYRIDYYKGISSDNYKLAFSKRFEF